MAGCCGRAKNSPQEMLMAKLRQVVELPDGARLVGADDGRRWRVVDRFGVEPDPPVGSDHTTTDLLRCELAARLDMARGVLVGPA